MIAQPVRAKTSHVSDPSRLIVAVSVVLAVLLGTAAFSATTRANQGYLVWSDGVAYFLYARSAVIDRDVDITNEFDELNRRIPADAKVLRPLRDWTRRDTNTGRIVAAWPLGAGLVMAPFYAVGFAVEALIARYTERDIDSYGLIPQYFYCAGSLFYGLLGFWFTYLSCRRVGTTAVSYLAVLATMMAGPLVFYIFVNPSMAHASSFGLASIFVWAWWKQWDSTTNTRGIVILGLLLGVLTTIRYQNALFGVLLVPLVIREIGRKSFGRAIWIGAVGLASSLVLPLVAALPALHAHAAPFQGEVAHAANTLHIGPYPFHFSSPNFLNVLTSCRHGAFYWAPVLALGLLGLVVSLRDRGWAAIFLTVFLLQVYLIGALGIAYTSGSEGLTDWNHYWQGAPSFGMRYLTECGVFLAVGLVSLMTAASRITTRAWAVIFSLLIGWNGMLVVAYGLGTVSRSYCVTYAEMGKGVYMAIKVLLSGSI